jgi:hypothetical protein
MMTENDIYNSENIKNVKLEEAGELLVVCYF